jgi:hypothetical protein
MKNQPYAQGALWEIPLHHGQGHAYAKVVLPHLLVKFNENTTEMLLLSVLDVRREAPLPPKPCPADLAPLAAAGQLCPPIELMGGARLRGEGRCRVLGVLPLTCQERVVPDFKEAYRILVDEDEAQHPYWGYVVPGHLGRPGEVSRPNPVTYEQVKHLEMSGMSVYDLVRDRVTMEWIRHAGGNVLDYYDLSGDDLGTDWLRMMYGRVKNSVPYHQVPPAIRGRAQDPHRPNLELPYLPGQSPAENGC